MAGEEYAQYQIPGSGWCLHEDTVIDYVTELVASAIVHAQGMRDASAAPGRKSRLSCADVAIGECRGTVGGGPWRLRRAMDLGVANASLHGGFGGREIVLQLLDTLS